MASDKMTIDEVKKRKIQLESDIMDLIKDFEKETGVFAGYVNIQRERSTDENGFDEPVATKSPSKKPVENVEVSMDLDLIY